MEDFELSGGRVPSLPQEVTDEVVRYYSPMIYRIALTKTKSTHDADDIFQEVFLKLVMREKPFETEEHRKAWLIRVTINCCNSHFVAPWRKNVDSMEDVLLEQIADDEPIPGAEEEHVDVYAEVMKLPEPMREVVLLFYYEDMSIREIAETVGTSEVNVKKRLSRARQKLKLELEGEDGL
jgi:RNA polymerase sigma-70 factor (ECF subfamily)